PIAMALGAGFVPMRKAGKLPAATVGQQYALEYGTATLEVHGDAFDTATTTPHDRVLIVDDVLATGGTASAAMALVTSAGARVAGLSFLIELGFLGGASALEGSSHRAVLTY
ncbi:MAG TPA: purine phosphoribosyltransferase family protein, partial [Euzebya sp.]|nr:purine phosphoribosyltransferase family protein [Euzebya sp.]